MKKKKIILILVAIVLGISSYFLATSLTKSYLDKESKKDTKIDFSEMTKLETSKDISLEKSLQIAFVASLIFSLSYSKYKTRLSTHISFRG